MISIFNYILITIGAVGVIVSLGYDFFRQGEPVFGNMQFMGFIGSVLILVAGLRKLSSTKNDFWNFISFLIYLAGLFYLVLMPFPYNHSSYTGMLNLTGFIVFDSYHFRLNVIGFLPFGYLLPPLVSKFAGHYKKIITFLVVLFLGFLLSFLIEIVQYFIPGRDSSLTDVTANGLGTFGGMLFFWIENHLTKKRYPGR